MKKCSKCKESIPDVMFSKDRTKRDGLYSSCRACCSVRALDAYTRDPSKPRERSKRRSAELRAIPGWKRAQHLWARYHMTIEQYDERLAAQGGRCVFCDEPPVGLYALSVDHDHDTGAVRGLLCVRHNTGLGAFGDNPAALRAAADYLERPCK
jgi:hypothetical protein